MIYDVPMEEKEIGILVPYQKLSQVALNRLIEEFILREGTDYGRNEYSLDEKKEQIFRQLQSGYIQVVFNPSTETTSLLHKEQIKKLNLDTNTLS